MSPVKSFFTFPATLLPLANCPVKLEVIFCVQAVTTPPWGTLGSPAFGRKEPPLAVASRLEHGPNQAQHPAIRYSLGHEREEFFVIDRPEEVSEVRVYDPLRPASYLLPNFA